MGYNEITLCLKKRAAVAEGTGRGCIAGKGDGRVEKTPLVTNSVRGREQQEL